MNRIHFLLAFLFCAGLAVAQSFQGRVSTSVYTFERADSAKQKTMYVRGYQSANLDYRYNSFLIHTSLNYENGYSNALDGDGRLRLYSLYAEYKNALSPIHLRLGRQSVLKQGAGGVFDGIFARAEYFGVKLDLYGGGNVPAYQKAEFLKDFSNNRIFGGELAFPVIEGLHAKAGYVDKAYKAADYTAIRLDEAFNPVQMLIRANSNQFKYVYGAFNYELAKMLLADTRFEYDLNLKKASVFELNSSMNITRQLGVTLFYQYREPRVRYNSIFAVFNYANTQEVELGADYRMHGDVSVSGRFGMTKYTDENAARFTIASTYKFLSASYRMTFGAVGEQTAASLSASRAYFDGLLSSTAAVSFVTYKISPDDAEAEQLLSAVLGVTVRPVRQLSLDLQGQYMHNEIYKNDMRLLFRAAYWFHTNF